MIRLKINAGNTPEFIPQNRHHYHKWVKRKQNFQTKKLVQEALFSSSYISFDVTKNTYALGLLQFILLYRNSKYM